MRVVRFVRMSEHAIRECSFDRAAHDIRSHDGGDLLAAIAAGKLDGGAAWRQAGAGNHCGKSVQDVFLGFLDYFVRQDASAGRTHVSAELLHHGADRLGRLVRMEKRSSFGETGRNCREDRGRAAELNQAPASH
jgi:hypothetical protein